VTIDTSVHLGHWAFRRHGYEETARLMAKLKAADIGEAWVASFDGIFHRDLAAVNARLTDECTTKGKGFLVPFGTVNPRLPDWEEDLRRCHRQHRMPGVRVYPGYHGYSLDDPEFAKLLKRAAEARLIVQLVVKMEDERTQSPLARVADVNLAPLPKLLAAIPGLTVQILNCPISPSTEALVPLARSGRVFFDIAMQESVGVVARLAERVGSDRVLFGSHFPLFHVESAILKLKEAGLEAGLERAIRSGTARSLVPKP
jgi:predicted TIM-barrel fold metal-dependent hydrolase